MVASHVDGQFNFACLRAHMGLFKPKLNRRHPFFVLVLLASVRRPDFLHQHLRLRVQHVRPYHHQRHLPQPATDHPPQHPYVSPLPYLRRMRETSADSNFLNFSFTSPPAFGFLQLLVILFASYMAFKFRLKSAILAALMIPCCVGSALLYALPRQGNTGPLLLGYYLIAFLFAGNPLLVGWLASNVGGQSKKSTLVAMYQVGSSVGNIVGPLLFKSKDAPLYKAGLRSVLGLFVAVVGIVGILVAMFVFLNKHKEAQRVRHGKPAKIHDRSMDAKYGTARPDEDEEVGKGGVALGGNSFKDISDFSNDEFVYCY